MRYIFVQDDDCHWYIIPENKRKEFEEWVDVHSNNDYDNSLYGTLPEWVNEVGGSISSISFENPKEICN